MKENIREDVLHFLPIVSSRNHTDGEIEEITQAMYDYHGLCVEDAGNDEAAGLHRSRPEILRRRNRSRNHLETPLHQKQGRSRNRTGRRRSTRSLRELV